MRRTHGRMCLLMGSMHEYDLVVIGSGPGGQKAAIAAAKLGKSVAVVERGQMLGGVCVNTGTIPSKTLREAVALPDRYEPARALRRQLPRQGQDHPGRPAGAHPARDRQADRRGALAADAQPGRADSRARPGSSTSTPCWSKTAPAANDHGQRRYIVIATGTKPARPAGVEFDENRVLDSDGILDLKSIPTSMVVVGAGVIGIEYASMFAALGTKVTVVEKRAGHAGLLRPRDHRGAAFHLRDLAVTFRFGEEVTARATSARPAPSPPWPAASRSPPRR